MAHIRPMRDTQLTRETITLDITTLGSWISTGPVIIMAGGTTTEELTADIFTGARGTGGGMPTMLALEDLADDPELSRLIPVQCAAVAFTPEAIGATEGDRAHARFSEFGFLLAS